MSHASLTHDVRGSRQNVDGADVSNALRGAARLQRQRVASDTGANVEHGARASVERAQLERWKMLATKPVGHRVVGAKLIRIANVMQWRAVARIAKVIDKRLSQL